MKNRSHVMKQWDVQVLALQTMFDDKFDVLSFVSLALETMTRMGNTETCCAARAGLYFSFKTHSSSSQIVIVKVIT
jgi:hypothetical protein